MLVTLLGAIQNSLTVASIKKKLPCLDLFVSTSKKYSDKHISWIFKIETEDREIFHTLAVQGR